MTMTEMSNSQGTQGPTGPKIAQTAGPNTTGPHTLVKESMSACLGKLSSNKLHPIIDNKQAPWGL